MGRRADSSPRTTAHPGEDPTHCGGGRHGDGLGRPGGAGDSARRLARDAAALGAVARRQGRRPGRPQVREPAARRVVQDPRRLRAPRAAHRRGAGARRRRGERRQPRAGRRARRLDARRPEPRCSCRWERRCPRSRPRAATAPRSASSAPSVDEALVAARAFADETGAVLIHPFDHADIVAGQGTVGLEILEQRPDVRTVVVCTGGGGLLAGVAVAIKAVRPDVRVVGVQAAGAAAYPGSLAVHHPVALASHVDHGRRHRGRPPGRHPVRARRRPGRRGAHRRRRGDRPRAGADPRAQQARGRARRGRRPGRRARRPGVVRAARRRGGLRRQRRPAPAAARDPPRPRRRRALHAPCGCACPTAPGRSPACSPRSPRPTPTSSRSSTRASTRGCSSTRSRSRCRWRPAGSAHRDEVLAALARAGYHVTVE